MINIFARCLIRFPVVTVWSGQGRMGGLEGRSSCEPLLHFSVEISSGSSELSRRHRCPSTQHMHRGLAGEKDAEQWTVWTACNHIYHQ